jgi:HEAT repeat protein
VVRDTARAAAIVTLGLRGPLRGDDLATVRSALADPSPRVRAAAIAAMVRSGPMRVVPAAWRAALRDPDPAVRRRGAELAPAFVARRRGRRDDTATTALVACLDDRDVTVVEAAAWALGELGPAVGRDAVETLAGVVRSHPDPLAREAAVAALGAIGDEIALDAILTACHDKPAVRRRAVLALAPFSGPAVDAAIAAALEDRDWQVRQAAEDLIAAGSA